MLYCQFSTEFFPELMNIFTKNYTVLLGKIYMLEYAMGGSYFTWRNKEPAVQAVIIKSNDFTRLDFSDKFCIYGIECTCFTGNYISAFFSLSDT